MMSEQTKTGPPQARPNRLLKEKSPYLLQHAYNPVDWFPWGEEAFARAREEDKPVFLSIGYSTCHWCHVMERESFEDPEVAALMNENMVSIKVDREERPDLDAIYMNACQLIAGQGGWPLTVFMSPDKRPFYAGTYFPKHSRAGRPGMIELVPRISGLWKSEREKIENVAAQVLAELERPAGICGGEAPTAALLDSAYLQLSRAFDNVNGGFGLRPKFPTPHQLTFLLRYHKRTGDKLALYMVERTLEKMRQGGMFDQIGFGFHRYSTDERWLVPHFEKMLYDQALLVMAYTEAFQATGKEDYARTAREIIAYVLRDLTSDQGAFFSAEDADSEGEEGRFYLWTLNQVEELLSPDEVELAARAYGLESAGNFVDELRGERTGDNLLHLVKGLPDLAHELGIKEGELRERLAAVRRKLFEARAKRERPRKDDKILADWNGLMIAALAKAAAALEEPAFAEAADRAARFFRERMRRADGRLYHRFRDGEAAIDAFLEDYAFMAWGLFELYQAGFNEDHLEWSFELTELMFKRFKDEARGGFYQSAESAEVIVRLREAHDGALPSGNSAAMLNLLRLSRIAARPEWAEEAERLFLGFFCTLRKAPAGYTFLLSAFDYALGAGSELVIAGDLESEDTRTLLAALRRKFLPHALVVLKPVKAGSEKIERLAGHLKAHQQIEGRATAHVCRNYNCRLPVTDPDKMMELLEEGR